MKCWACGEREAVSDAAFCDPCLEAFEDQAEASVHPVQRCLAKLALRYSRSLGNPGRRGRVTYEVRRVCAQFDEPMPLWAARRIRPPAQKPTCPPSTPLSHYLMCDAAKLLGITKSAIQSRVNRKTCPVEAHLGRRWVPAWWVERELIRKAKKKTQPIPDMKENAA